MVKILKRIGVSLVLICAVVWLAVFVKKLLDYPHLYLDLHELELSNALLLGGALLSLALAVVAGIYLEFNVNGKLPDVLISLVCCLALLTGSYFLIKGGLEGMPCSYSTSPADYAAEFDAARFRVDGKNLYPREDRGIISAYSDYKNGEVRWQRVIRSFDKLWAYNYEVRRLDALGLDTFEGDNWICYEKRQGDTVWQIQADKKTQQVVYSRYDKPDQKPGVAPDLLEPSEDEPENLRPTARPEGGDT